MSDKTLETILNELQSINRKMDNGLDTLGTQLDKLETKIDGISEQVAKNAEDITDIKDNQKIIANVIDKVASVQERQEKILESLSLRSLEQEVDIRDLKRIK